MRKLCKNKLWGIVLTLSVHLSLLVLLLAAGLHLTHMPVETGIEFEFEPQYASPKPQAVIPPVRQTDLPRASSPKTQAERSTSEGPDDAEPFVPQKDSVKPINPRALYKSRHTGELPTGQKNAGTGEKLQSGYSKGDSTARDADGNSSVKLEGRSVLGKLPLPDYTVNQAGRVVVRIWVDPYGKVSSARAGAAGTTVQDRTLWEAARKAALQARFSTSGKAPALQEGTITYIFKLK